MAPRVIDEMGKQYGWLTVVAYGGFKKGKTRWVCVCKCGTIKFIRAECLRGGKGRRQTVSCGCYATLRDRLPPSTEPDPWLERFQRERAA